MFRKPRLAKTIKKITRQVNKNLISPIKKQIVWLLRTLFITKKRRGSVNAGFVLPTVAMVALVVVLITTAILFRSFERSKNASNVRVNEVVLKAAAPALDRAKAKLDEIFKDPRLPRATPSDLSLTQVIDQNIDDYTFGDEIQLKLVKELNGKPNIQAEEETVNSAWKYPVDTDNNGKFDSFTIYGIFFRTPTTTRARNTLEARTQPMDEGAVGNKCDSEFVTSADLVGSQGWYKVGSKLKRSLFVYTTTVPITAEPTQDTVGKDYAKYEKFTGNKSFVALEYQQDRERIPLANNAVIYEDDLEIAPGAGIKLNGRVFTNANLLTRQRYKDDYVQYYLVSSPKSCYYQEENSKIVVAGNLINSRVTESSTHKENYNVRVDMFNKSYAPINNTQLPANKPINSTNQTVLSTVFGNTAAYNDEAYVRRIERLIEATNSAYPNNTDLPDELQEEIKRDLDTDPTLNPTEVRNDKLKVYFRKRTRRVPYAEVPFGTDPLVYGSYDFKTNSPIEPGSAGVNNNALRPVDPWAFPFKPDKGIDEVGFANIAIHPNSTSKLYLSATEPEEQAKAGKENDNGDRILVGNNLPQLWYDQGKFVSSEQGQLIDGRQWNFNQSGGNTTDPRKRFSQAYQLDDLGVTDRNDFWEKSAAQKPSNPLDVVGGLRVITGAGIYLPDNRNLSSTDAELKADLAQTKEIWPDSMPIGITQTDQGLPKAETPYLKMRATAVYHYQHDPYDPTTPSDYQVPIACVSSYYDPNNSKTAVNQEGLPDIRKRVPIPPETIKTRALALTTTVSAADKGNSNNGVVYPPPPTDITAYRPILDYQAELKYPNGRWVNKPLRDAVDKLKNSKPLTLEHQSAVDSAVCAIKIKYDNTFVPTDAEIPHGAIMETAFLDARQIKAIDKVVGSRNYDLDVELRQPLEIRATVLDMDLLRRKSRTDGEFLFPNSGIIYATRDDALPDESTNPDKPDLNATDFKLDPTRRPNSIMLINGADLSRNDTYKAAEKGLILASNLPVYIQGQQIDSTKEEGFFNQHTHEEFEEDRTDSWDNFYTRKTLDTQFACRKDQFSSCTEGETWRSVTVIADNITVLSHKFRTGFRNEGDYSLRNNYDVTDTSGNKLFIPFDADGDGSNTGTVQESVLGLDLNDNGDIVDTINEATQITSSAARRINGFWDNNFVTSYPWQDNANAEGSSGYGYPATLDATPALIKSSYFNNFVTPIQRRVPFAEYVMEICRKPIVTRCKPEDWVVSYDKNGDGKVDVNDPAERDVMTYGLTPNDSNYKVNKLGAGTTARPPLNPEDRNYPRRVAFLRNKDTGNLVLSGSRPIPLGIKGTDNPADPATDDAGQINYYPYSDYIVGATKYPAYVSGAVITRPRLHPRALWFRTTKSNGTNYGYDYPLAIYNYTTTPPIAPIVNSSSVFNTAHKTDQPLLIPVLQIQYPFLSAPADKNVAQENPPNFTTGADNILSSPNNSWLQRAVKTETNLVFAQGNIPARPDEGNGGLENLVTFLESWSNVRHVAAGAFIQFKRSIYATAPVQVSLSTDTSANGGIFSYPQAYRIAVDNPKPNWGRTPFLVPPLRFWGYDVALLTQLPDLFSQRFTSPSLNAPNEFFREVPRDDAWVKTLLCTAAQEDSTGGYKTAGSSEYGDKYKYALSDDQRSTCP